MRQVIRRLKNGADDGMSTAEYAIGTVAACGFAGLLLKLLTSESVFGLIKSMITGALKHVM